MENLDYYLESTRREFLKNPENLQNSVDFATIANRVLNQQEDPAFDEIISVLKRYIQYYNDNDNNGVFKFISKEYPKGVSFEKELKYILRMKDVPYIRNSDNFNLIGGWKNFRIVKADHEFPYMKGSFFHIFIYENKSWKFYQSSCFKLDFIDPERADLHPNAIMHTTMFKVFPT